MVASFRERRLMHNNDWLLFISCAALLFTIAKIRKSADNAEEKVRLYEAHSRQWKMARENRLRWREEHSFLTNPFSYSEYEELWRYEIAQEALLRMEFPVREISWREYKVELWQLNAEENKDGP